MQYRIDKKSGNKLSVLGFGCMRFPRTFGMIDMTKTEEMVMHSIENGVNYFDTAWIYPGSEDALGTVLKKNNARENVYIASKLPLVMVKKTDDFDKFFYQSLERLKTNTIDYYLMHMLTDLDQWTKLKQAGIEEWILQKKKSGEIKQIGFSFHGPGNEFLKIIDDYDWEFSMIQYNYSDENYQAGVTGLREASKKMPVMIMEPLLGGKLAANLPKAAVEVFKKTGKGLSPAGWALNWVWNQGEVTLLLSGMSNMSQLKENLQLADTCKEEMLGVTEFNVYKSVLEIVNKANKIRCTACNYCMPCPFGVNIPGSFSAYNTRYSMGYIAGMQHFALSTGFLSAKGSGPDMCTKCGKCESHCPQHISIIKELEVVRKKMEPFWMRFAGVCARAFMKRKRKKKNVSA